MALITCKECGNDTSSQATGCPRCGAPVGGAVPPISRPAHRKVSIPLGIGIALLPMFFAWFLLGRGYSTTARVIGFGWLALIAVMMAISQPTPENGTATASQVDVDPQRVDKDRAAYMAKQAVPAAMKDPSSAEFGEVWGMSATVACGFVNGKNGFGAMAGQTRFIYDAGNIQFQESSANFVSNWNELCVDKPKVAAPTGVGGIKWGGKPTSALKPYMPETDDGLSLYVPIGKPEPLEGVPVAEANFNFDHKHLYLANFYLDGEAQRDAILRKLVDKYGTPQSYDQAAGNYSWSWPKNMTIYVRFDAKDGRTTVTYNKEEKS